MFSPEKYVCWQALQQGITLMPLENVQGGDMPGDMAHISAPVCRRVEKLLPHLVTKLEEKYGTDIPAKLVIAVSGGSGSGKTSGAAALREALAMVGLKGYVLSGDNYPRRIPQHNDEERLTIFRSAGLKALLAAGEYTPERFADLQPLQKTGIDSDPRQCAAYPWMQIYQQGGRAALAGYLGRTAEQDYDALNAVLAQFRAGAPVLWLKRMGRKEWERWYEPKNFADVDVLLLEWTHAGSADLKNTNLKVFFNSTPEETRACRVARSRDAGADSPFVTMVLEIEQALFMPGKPQVWYLDLFAGKNDCEAVARAGEGGHKEINRTNLTKVQIAEALEKPVVKKQLELLRLRRNCPAFAQGAKIQIESCGPELTIEWSCSGHVARLQANLQKLTYRVEIE